MGNLGRHTWIEKRHGNGRHTSISAENDIKHENSGRHTRTNIKHMEYILSTPCNSKPFLRHTWWFLLNLIFSFFVCYSRQESNPSRRDGNPASNQLDHPNFSEKVGTISKHLRDILFMVWKVQVNFIFDLPNHNSFQLLVPTLPLANHSLYLPALLVFQSRHDLLWLQGSLYPFNSEDWLRNSFLWQRFFTCCLLYLAMFATA